MVPRPEVKLARSWVSCHDLMEPPENIPVRCHIITNPTVLTCIVLTNEYEYEDCCEMFGRGPHCYRRTGVLSTDIIFTADCANVNKMTGTLTPRISPNSTQPTFYWWVW